MATKRYTVYALYDSLDNAFYVGITSAKLDKAVADMWRKRDKRAGALGEWLRGMSERPRAEVLADGISQPPVDGSPEAAAERVRDTWVKRFGEDHLTNGKDSAADVAPRVSVSKEPAGKRPSPLRGRTLTPEHKAKISKALKGKGLRNEHKTKISKTQKGRVFSEEHKRKLREAWERRRARMGMSE